MNNQRFYYVPAFIIASIALIEMATDMYLPNLPAVVKEFNTTESLLQLTLSVNLFGLATAGLVAGPLSDTLGRRNMLLSGLILFLIAGMGCMLAPSVDILIIARLLQGLGGGVVLVVGTAAIRDLYQAEKLAKIMSMMGMVIAVSPGIAPIIGGYIGMYFDWRATFGFLVVCGAILVLIAFLTLPETLDTRHKKSFSIKLILKNYLEIFKIPAFVLNALLLALTIAQLWIEMGNLPFLYIQTLNVPSHHYGIYFGSSVFIFVLGTLFNQRYVMTYGVDRLLFSGILLKVISVLFICFAAWLNIQQAWLIQLLFYPGAFGLALVISNASSRSLSAITQHVGCASAVLYLLEMALAGLALYIAGLFFNNTLWPIAISGIIWMGLVFGLYGLRKMRIT
jgi:DHA1 family bicyclomycin/chloramphenicol resistance-like MFS transporter